MTVLNKLASSLNRRDEQPNIELAKSIVKANNTKAVEELIGQLFIKQPAVQHDCIKVLYEIGDLKPELISSYYPEFIKLLTDKNNRMQWGAMAALDAITTAEPAIIYKQLPKLAAASDKGSVITRDRYILILIKLGSMTKYASDAFTLLNEQLICCPINQSSMYAEKMLPLINAKNKDHFIQTVSFRLADVEKETQKKRMEKILRAAGKK